MLSKLMFPINKSKKNKKIQVSLWGYDLIHYIFRFILKNSKKLRLNLKYYLLILKEGLSKESFETKQMLEIYYRYSIGKANDNELFLANKQFKSFLKTIGLGFLVFLPFSPITIPFMVKLGKNIGINILPNSFKDKF